MEERKRVGGKRKRDKRVKNGRMEKRGKEWRETNEKEGTHVGGKEGKGCEGRKRGRRRVGETGRWLLMRGTPGAAVGGNKRRVPTSSGWRAA